MDPGYTSPRSPCLDLVERLVSLFLVPRYSYFLRNVNVWPTPGSWISVRSQGSPVRAKVRQARPRFLELSLQFIGLEPVADQLACLSSSLSAFSSIFSAPSIAFTLFWPSSTTVKTV